MYQLTANPTSRRERRQKARRLVVLTDAQVALGWFVILALAALVGAVYVSQASRIATTGRRVQILQNDLEDLKRQNASLERDIAEAQSLQRLQAEAVRLGFVRASPEAIEYLALENVPVSMPAPSTTDPATVELLPATAPPLETMQEALSIAVEARVSVMMRGEAGE